MRELDFNVKKAILKTAYGTDIKLYENVNALPINTSRDYYDTNLGIIYIHAGQGPLPLELARKPLVYLKQALLHECFINELDKALVGENYNMKLFKKAVDEFLSIHEYENKVLNEWYVETISKLIAKI